MNSQSTLSILDYGLCEIQREGHVPVLGPQDILSDRFVFWNESSGRYIDDAGIKVANCGKRAINLNSFLFFGLHKLPHPVTKSGELRESGGDFGKVREDRTL